MKTIPKSMIKVVDKESSATKLSSKFEALRVQNWSNDDEFPVSPENLIEESKKKRMALKKAKEDAY